MSKYSEDNPHPAVYYLLNNARKNEKLIRNTLWILVAIGVILGIATTIPSLTDPLPEHLLKKLILDIPVWLMVIPLPLILLFKSKPHKEWQETHKNTMECHRKSITAKEFAAVTYLEIFFATIISLAPLIINWGAAIVESSDVREKLFTIGVFNLGAVFFHIWTMTALFFILRFTKIAKIARRAVLMLLCFFASLSATLGLQSLLYSLEIPFTLAAAICAFLGLIILRIGCAITARLYEKVDL